MLLRLIRRWPWLFAAMCLGGLLGLGIEALSPPIYEAVAVVGVGVDYGRTLPLDEEAMRHALDRTREVFLADETLEAVLGADERSEAQFDSVNELRSTLRLSEIDGGWELGVRSGSAEDAARLANVWASAAFEQLQAAVGHDWRAADLQSKWYIAGCGLQLAAAPSGAAVWSCSTALDEYDPEQALTEIEQEAVLSRGILPSMSFSLLQDAEVPEEPLTSSRTLCVLGGLLAGAVVGLIVACALGERAPRR
jgi:hypothetical protein